VWKKDDRFILQAIVEEKSKINYLVEVALSAEIYVQ
jgi:hypothetical protein